MIMTRILFLLLTVTILTAAMPKSWEKRVLNTEEEEPQKAVTGKAICSNVTPCGWSLYSTSGKITETIINSYCSCKQGTTCIVDEDDKDTSAFVLRCQSQANTKATAAES